MRSTAKELEAILETMSKDSHHLNENSRQTFEFLHGLFRAKNWLSHADERIVFAIQRELSKAK